MKKIFLSALFCAFTGLAFGQTKTETPDYIGLKITVAVLFVVGIFLAVLPHLNKKKKAVPPSMPPPIQETQQELMGDYYYRGRAKTLSLNKAKQELFVGSFTFDLPNCIWHDIGIIN